jgi:CRISPR type III-A-associated RAMP protein Csm4
MDGLLVRLKPNGPWRYGSETGAKDDLSLLYHSDAVFSAVTHAMASLGDLDSWLDATARSSSAPAVRFTSCFPWQKDVLFVVPPRNVWPASSQGAQNLRAARFVPVAIVVSLLKGQPPDDDFWCVDAHSRCLIPRSEDEGSGGPFCVTLRSSAAVDRVTRSSHHLHQTAGVEFSRDAGLWLAICFADESARLRWTEPVQSAIRLLADSGFGGRRSSGWGRAETPEFRSVSLDELLLPNLAPTESPEQTTEAGELPPAQPAAVGHWMLSLFRPGEGDSVDWEAGSYSLITRGGRIESAAGWGDEKRLVRMVAEGSVVVAPNAPAGSAADVAPEGYQHPVFRYGFPVSIPVPTGVIR